MKSLPPPSHPALRLIAGAVALWLISCGASPITPSSRAAGSACTKANAQRARAPGLLAQGKLDRVLRVLAAADSLCPEERDHAWALEVETLAEIGRYAEARTLATTIEGAPAASAAAREGARRARAIVAERDHVFAATDAAKAPMRHDYREAQEAESSGHHELARDRYLKAWSEWHPNGQALYAAGHNALQMGAVADAQRLFDRAIVELEAFTGARVAPEIPSGLHAVRTVAWAPNGKMMAVADESEIVLVDVVTGRERERLRGHAGLVRTLAFSRDGAVLASAGDGATIRLWDLANHGPPQLLTGYSGVSSVAFSSDGRTLAAVGDDGLQVWSLLATTKPRILAEPGGAGTTFTFSEDNRFVTSMSDDGSVRVFGLDAGPVRTWSTHTATSLGAFSPDGKRFAAGGPLGMQVWDVASAALTATIYQVSRTKTVNEARSIAFSPDGQLLAMGMIDGTARLVDARTGELVRTFQGNEGFVRLVAFSPDGLLLASTSTSEAIRLWDARTGKERAVLGRRLGSPLRALVFSPDGGSLALVADDPIVRVVGAEAGRHPLFLHTDNERARSIAFSGDGGKLASGAEDMSIRIWDARTGDPLQKLSGHTAPVTSVAFVPDGKLVSAAPGEAVREWDVDGEPIKSFPASRASRGVIAVSPDGHILAIGEEAGFTRLVTLDTGVDLAVLDGHVGPVRALAFSHDGKLLASGASDEAIDLMDPTGSSEILKLHNHPWGVDALAFSPDSRQLVSGYSSSAVRLWDIETGKVTLRVQSHGGAVLSVAFSPNGKVLASSGSSSASDGTVDLWSLPTGRLLGTIGVIRDRDASYVTAPSGQLGLDGEMRDVPICRVGPLSYPFELCEERFAVPDLLARLLVDDRSYLDP
ncbi:MAG: hypothetical protein ABJE95_12795 [Byssovorax sp.]